MFLQKTIRTLIAAITILNFLEAIPALADSPSIDCTERNPHCPQLAIAGDAPQLSKFRGFADPSMRRDPNTGTLWLSYSWPHTLPTQRRALFPKFSKPDVAVDIHLARSNDDGGHWTYAGPLWQTSQVINPASKEENFLSHEISNMLPRNQNGKTTWYGIRFDYLVKPGKFIYSQMYRFSYFALSMAATPLQLADAPSQMLGFAGTAKELEPDVYLSALHPDLAECLSWLEPALTFQDNKLYLAARCMHFSRWGKAQAKKDFYAIFSVKPEGDIKTWQWQYNGKLAGPAEAAELDNHQFLTQFDFARKSNGQLLGIVTTADPGGPQNELFFGCRVLPISSLEPPTLARDASRKLIVLAKITASDLNSSGTGACAYEPSADTGIIFTRKLIRDPIEGYYWDLHETGLKP